jgi:F-type H+/Na+-transporting ATPase subunit alpha
VSLYLVTKGHLDEIAVEDVRRFEAEFHAFLDANHQDVLKDIVDKKELKEDNEKKLLEAIAAFKKSFVASN